MSEAIKRSSRLLSVADGAKNGRATWLRFTVRVKLFTVLALTVSRLPALLRV